MTQEKKDFVNIIKSSLTPFTFSFEGNAEHIISLATYHTVEVMTYYGFLKNNIEVSDQFKKTVKTAEYKAIFQDAERDSIKKAFNENKIKFMPLKGCITTDLYPVKGMRQMADLDILVPKEDYKKVKKVMLSLGYYVEADGGNHDVYYKKPFMNIEVHREMVSNIYKTANKYYEDIWDRVKNIDGTCEYYLSNEDFYIFMIVHGEKHFSLGGTGLKILTDIYLFLEKYQETMDFDYIEKEFEKLNILNFSKKIKTLSLKVFKNEELTEDEDIMLSYILDSGTYGNTKNAILVNSFLKEDTNIAKAKRSHIFRRLFPKFDTMKNSNPVLEKLPFLLPFFYIKRLLKGLFNFKKAKRELDEVKKTNEEDIERIKLVHKAAGLEKRQNED